MIKRGLKVLFLVVVVLVSLGVVMAIGSIDFVDPTLGNNNVTTTNSIYVNVSVSNANTSFLDWNNSLVGWWRFNNETGENSTFIRDWSTWGNNGTVTDAIFNSTGGKYGGAFEFDGVGDYITIPFSQSLNFSQVDEITISEWVKLDSGTSAENWHTLNYVDLGAFRTLMKNTTLFFELANSTGAVSIQPSFSFNLNTWYHLVFGYNGSEIYVYINGVKHATTGSLTGNLFDSNNDWLIGYTGGRYLNGSIDDIIIFRRALSPEEINATYNAKLYKYYRNFTNLADGNYTFKAYAQNESGGINSTETRNITVYTTPAITLNNPTDNTLSSDSTSFNCSALANSQFPDLVNITFYWNYSGSFIANGTVNISGARNSTNFTRTNLEEKTFIWNCYACNNQSNCAFASSNYTLTIDSTYPQINFTSPTQNSGVTTSNTSIIINISITESDLNEVKFNWNGTNYTLYNDSLLFMMNFDNVSALGENDTYAADVSKYSNNGTWGNLTTGNISYVAGKFGKAFEFDGVDDYVNINEDEDLNFGVNDFSWGAWIKTTSSDRQMIITQGAAQYSYIDLNQAVENLIGLRLYSSTAGIMPSTASFVVNDGEWHHIFGTLDRDNNAQIYVDGVAGTMGQADISSAEGVNVSGTVRIGTFSTSTSFFFNGTIDEVRIFNHSLSQSEVQQLYFSNLRKYDTDKWNLYVNQSNLTNGNQTYQAFISDSAGNLNQTEERTVTIAAAVINAYNLNYTNYWVKKNNALLLNITDCGGLFGDQFTFNWTIDGALASSSREFNLSSSNYSVGVYNLVGYCYDEGGSSDSQNFTIEIIDSSDFSFIFFSDTHGNSYFSDQGQTAWIPEMKNGLNIAFMAYGGDFVTAGQGSNATQWAVINNSMAILDNNLVPYGTAPGNHDYNSYSSTSRNTTSFNTFFNLSRYESYSWWGGSKGNGDNTYFFFNESNMEFMIMFLEFCPRNATITWANDTINNNSDKRVIIVTHLYMDDDDTRMNSSSNYTCSGAGYNNGEDMWDKLISKHENIFLVQSGHQIIRDGIGYRNDTGAGGNIVHQIVSNYQAGGGRGYLRIYRFAPDENTIYAKTYSPNLDVFNTSSVQNFSMYYNMATAPTTTEEPTPSGGGGYPILKLSQEQLEEGCEKSLRKNWKMQFELNNKTHVIKLDDIINKTAIITISSEPVTFNLTLNETKKLNLDDDEYYDLEVFLKDISDYRADLVLKLIHEEIPKCEPNWECTEWSECVNNIQTRTCKDLNNCNVTEARPDEERECEPKTDYITIVIVSALIAAAVIAGFLVRKQLTKRKRKRSHFC